MDVLVSVGTPYPSRQPWEHPFPPLPDSHPSVKQALLIPARVISLSGSTDSVLLTDNIASCMPRAGKEPVCIPSVYTWVLGWITESLRSSDRVEPYRTSGVCWRRSSAISPELDNQTFRGRPGPAECGPRCRYRSPPIHCVLQSVLCPRSLKRPTQYLIYFVRQWLLSLTEKDTETQKG